MPSIKLSTGINLFYEASGSGDPIIFIPGTSMPLEIWEFQVAALSDKFHVIAVDPRGASRTDAPTDMEAYSPALMAHDIAAMMDTLELRSAHIAGMSLGSAIGQELALHYPERVRSLQLHATWGRSDAWFLQVFVEPMLNYLDAGNLRGLFKFGQGMTMSPGYLEEKAPPRVFEIVTRCLVKHPFMTTPTGLRGQLMADARHDTMDRLPSINVPTIVTVGEADTNTPQRYGRVVAERIPNCTLHCFEGPRSGHCAFWEMMDEFNAVMLKFLARVT